MSVFCQCGCGTEIVPKPHHKYRPTKFIYGHWARVPEYRERMLARMRKRPSEEEARLLTGICACGCGGATKIVKLSRPRFGEYTGYPNRYIHGHHPRGKSWGRGRFVTHSGYVQVRMPGHALANANGYVKEHRLVMARLLGRDLLHGENIHHRNGDRGDNRPENLELWIKSQPCGQRAEDLVAWARTILRQYGDLFPEPTTPVDVQHA